MYIYKDYTILLLTISQWLLFYLLRIDSLTTSLELSPLACWEAGIKHYFVIIKKIMGSSVKAGE